MQGCGVWRHTPLKLCLFCDLPGDESSLWAILSSIICSTAIVQRLLWGLQRTELFSQVSPSALPLPAPAQLNCSFWVPLKNVCACVCGSHSCLCRHPGSDPAWLCVSLHVHSCPQNTGELQELISWPWCKVAE